MQNEKSEGFFFYFKGSVYIYIYTHLNYFHVLNECIDNNYI